MTIRKVGNKWVADVNFGRKYDGTRDRRIRRFDTKAEAEACERAMLVERDAARGMSGRIKWEDFLEHVYWPQKRDLRANTAHGYRRDIDLRLDPAFAGMYLDQINRLAIQRMLSSCPTRKAAENARDTLSAILGVAVDMEILARNPAKLKYGMPPGGRPDPQRMGVWLSTFSDCRRFLDELSAHAHGTDVERAMTIGLCMGLRKGEILGLDWERVDLARREARIVQTYVTADGGSFLAEPKTPRSYRTVPIPEFAARCMESWDRPDKPTDVGLDKLPATPVVHGIIGKRVPSRTATVRVGKLVKKAGLERVTLASCRHSFATSCINAGIPVSTVSAWLGHCDVTTTYNRYVRPLLSDLHDGADAIDRNLGL